MKIVKLETMYFRIPLSIPISMAIGTVNEVDHILVKIFTNDGLVGLGETAAELGPIFSEEFQSSITSIINDYLGPALIGEAPADIELILNKMDKIAKGNWFAKSAIEMALYDIMGKAWKVPVYQILGGLYRSKAIVSTAVTTMDPQKDAEIAFNAIKEGCRLIKMKVGALDSKLDVERIKAVRESISNDNIPIIIDANGAWRAEEAIRIIKQIENFNIIVEQPVHRGDDRGLRKIRNTVKVPIMLDESIFTPQDAINAIINETADIFSIKISKAGGLYRAKKIAAIAESAGIPCFVGGMEEIGLGIAAGLHFVMSTRNVEYGTELKPNAPHGITLPNIKIMDGYIHVTEGIGLGVELIEDQLQRYRID